MLYDYITVHGAKNIKFETFIAHLLKITEVYL